MKKVLGIITLILLVTAGCAAYGPSYEGGYSSPRGDSYAVGQQDYGQGATGEMDMDYAYNYLAPYGNWVDMSNYGYVWVPRNMGYRWRPYTDGHWVLTDYGWTWISDQSWGWIPFHYGRWGFDDGLGWYWVPGTVWGPAWVSWRSSDQYMGWAPIPPGIEFRAGMDFAGLRIDIPGPFWIFIGGSHFMDRDLYPYVLPYERNITIINYTVINNNYGFRGDRFYNEGVGIDTVRRATRRNIPRYTLRDSRQAGPARVMGNDLQIYRPAFKANPGLRPKAFLNRDQAQQELAPAKIFEPREKSPKLTAEAAVRRRQIEEQRLLKTSQDQELKSMDLRRNVELKRVQASAEKVRIQKDFQAKRSELAKQHQVEKLQMTERHKKDTEVVKRTVSARKEAPPKKKKK